jgi:asparagine synthase (glutamine-hydrolysing)
MCGIFALLNNTKFDIDVISDEFMKGQKRGPEFSKLETSYTNMVLGFHRLAINGLNTESNQPLVINDIVLICNGEIYNYRELYRSMNIKPITESDCEVIIHMYIKYGIEQTLNMIEGEYAFLLYDTRIKQIYVARDQYGVRPLYYLKNENTDTNNIFYGFASELKCLEYFYNNSNDNNNNNCDLARSINQFEPGTYSSFNLTYLTGICFNAQIENFKYGWNIEKENVPYFVPGFSHSWTINNEIDNDFIINLCSKIATYLHAAVNKRCLTTERPIACLLSGGLDSSLVAALVKNYHDSHNLYHNKLETYSIGLEGSEDLKYAKIVADYLGTVHTEIIVTEDEMFDAIPEVIRAIESYDTTTVRASIGNYLLGKYISRHSEAKVIFNGDGSDELFGGYLYMNKCPDDIEFDKEIRRLLKDIHMFDVLRSDKSISSHGLEPRTPFLDRSFANFILSIPSYIRNHINYNKKNTDIEKYILRRSFSECNFKNCNGKPLLPDIILWRKKEAFSDGVSGHGRSLYQILQDKIASRMNALEKNKEIVYTACIEIEKKYYKLIFDNAYPNCTHILPYFWMPKYTNATDPSARTLQFYSEK